MFRHHQKGETIHAVVDEAMALRGMLDSLAFDADELLRLGALYVNRERQHSDGPLEAGDYVRIHTRPKRYETTAIDWDNVVVFDSDDLLIVNKPAGLPVHPTLDNALENLVYQLSKHRNQSLWGTHRLDQLTQGLVVIAKSRQAATRFHRLLAERKVEKRYRALAERSVVLGQFTAYLEPSVLGRKTLSATPHEGWIECQLEILSCDPISKDRFEITINLLTGRTHQIRGQLSLLGAPIIGDPIYGGLPNDTLCLQAFSLSFPWKNTIVAYSLKREPWQPISL